MDNLDKVFKQELGGLELGDKSELWKKFEAKRKNKPTNNVILQLAAAMLVLMIALPYSLKELYKTSEITETPFPVNTEIKLQEIELNLPEEAAEVSEIIKKEELFSNKVENNNSVIALKTKSVNANLISNTNSGLKIKQAVKYISHKTENNKKFSLGVKVNPEELLAKVEEEKQKGPAELFASQLFKSISEKSKNFISYTKIE